MPDRPILIENAQIVADSVIHGWLRVEAGKIAAFAAGTAPDMPEAGRIDAGGQLLAPGFIDVHVHGGNGHEVMDATEDALRELARFYARHGVTSFLPTTWTASHADIMRALQSVAPLVNQVTDGATVLGAHVEGPYLNAAKSGAQSPDLIRRADPIEAREILDTGIIRLLALAPEFPENHWLIEECVRRGITVSAAHTDADYATMQQAVTLGLRQTTHTFNAMRGLHHREPGTVGAALTLDALRCEVIPDPFHLHPVAVQLVHRVKGDDGTIIITDAVRGAGLPEGATYTQDGRPVTIEGGAARLPGGVLAGSVLTMDEAVRNFVQFAESTLTDVWRCASLTPAQAIGVADRKGSIATGKDADLVMLDTTLNVQMTLVAGRVVYQAHL